jgi:tRNA C32,U32 (ribose-2'-O)-methylase TrmJ
MSEMTRLTNEEIREFNLWLYDNPSYQALSWSEQVALFLYEKYRKEAA